MIKMIYHKNDMTYHKNDISQKMICHIIENGSIIKTILTKSAKEFVTPLSITSLSQGKVYEDLFNPKNEYEDV